MSTTIEQTEATIQTNLGELIAFFYQEFLIRYGDAELACVAAAAVIEELLAEGEGGDKTLPQVA